MNELLYLLRNGLILFFTCWGITQYAKGKKSKKNKPNLDSEWIWDEDKQLWVHESEYAKKIRIDRSNPTFEEWKAERTSARYSGPTNWEPMKESIPEKYHYAGSTIPENRFEIPKGPMPKPPKQHSPQNTTETEKKAKKVEEPPKRSWTIPKQPQIIYTYPKAQFSRKIEEPNILDFQNAYQRRDFLTQNEWKNYQRLHQILNGTGYSICPKVRLFDLLEPKYRNRKDKTYQYKIQAKHVDFVICDKDMKVKAIIELDDSSHFEEDRIKRDIFVDAILLSVGYTVIHTLKIDAEILNYI